MTPTPTHSTRDAITTPAQDHSMSHFGGICRVFASLRLSLEPGLFFSFVASATLSVCMRHELVTSRSCRKCSTTGPEIDDASRVLFGWTTNWGVQSQIATWMEDYLALKLYTTLRHPVLRGGQWCLTQTQVLPTDDWSHIIRQSGGLRGPWNNSLAWR